MWALAATWRINLLGTREYLLGNLEEVVMFGEQSIESILAKGAIGLGFLLAFLTYRLLKQERTDHTPIYVFQFFCLALVLVGAWLQYSENKTTLLHNEISELQNELSLSAEAIKTKAGVIKTNEEEIAKLEGSLTGNKHDSISLNQKNTELQSMLNSCQLAQNQLDKSLETTKMALEKANRNLNNSQRDSSSLKRELVRTQQVLINIAGMIPKSVQELNSVNNILTGNVCSGGKSGIPIWGGQGTAAAARSNKVITNLEVAKNSIEGVLP